MKRHPTRVITVGNFKVANALHNGRTNYMWYYMWIGSKWYPFDIRDVAAKAGVKIPNVSVNQFLSGPDLEARLLKVLENVAVWCKTINAQDYIKR